MLNQCKYFTFIYMTCNRIKKVMKRLAGVGSVWDTLNTVNPHSICHGLLLVAYLGCPGNWPRWATPSSPW
jgi:hypothetical protein